MRKILAIGTFLTLALLGSVTGYSSISNTDSGVVPSMGEIKFITAHLNNLQRQSIQENREYCGYIGLDANDSFVASKPIRGKRGHCDAGPPPHWFEVIASYHTHGAHHRAYDSETPSSDDILADAEEGLDGYVSTPGGRLWFIDGYRETAYLICDSFCVNSDPDYDPSDHERIKDLYSLEDILNLEETD